MTIPKDPKQRLRGAIDAASIAIAIRHRERLDAGVHDHVIVVAVPDCPIGQQFIVGALGAHVVNALTGPVVLVFAESAFISFFTGSDREHVRKLIADLNAKHGDIRVIAAVNGGSIETRLIRNPYRLPAMMPLKEMMPS